MREALATEDAACATMCARHLLRPEHAPLADLLGPAEAAADGLRLLARAVGSGWAVRVEAPCGQNGQIMDARAREGLLGSVRGEWPWRDAAAGLLGSAMVRCWLSAQDASPSLATLERLRWPAGERALIEQLAIVWRQSDPDDLAAIDRIVCALYALSPDERFTLQRWRWQHRTT